MLTLTAKSTVAEDGAYINLLANLAARYSNQEVCRIFNFFLTNYVLPLYPAPAVSSRDPVLPSKQNRRRCTAAKRKYNGVKNVCHCRFLRSLSEGTGLMSYSYYHLQISKHLHLFLLPIILQLFEMIGDFLYQDWFNQ